jgi:hypothetical protein
MAARTDETFRPLRLRKGGNPKGGRTLAPTRTTGKCLRNGKSDDLTRSDRYGIDGDDAGTEQDNGESSRH